MNAERTSKAHTTGIEKKWAITLALAVGWMQWCGGGGAPPPPPPPAPDFRLTVTPTSTTVQAGTSTSNVGIFIAGENEFTGSVAVTLAGLPRREHQHTRVADHDRSGREPKCVRGNSRIGAGGRFDYNGERHERIVDAFSTVKIGHNGGAGIQLVGYTRAGERDDWRRQPSLFRVRVWNKRIHGHCGGQHHRFAFGSTDAASKPV